MKVLFITHYSAMFGANRSMLQLIIELKEKGVESTVLLPTPKDNSDLKNELEKERIPFIEVPIRWIKHPDVKKTIANYLYAVALYPNILSKLTKQKFDIIHTNSSVVGVGKYLSRKLKVPHVWHLREFGDIDYNLKTPFGKWFQRYLYSGNNYFIAISNKIHNHFKPFIGKNPIEIIYNGVKPTTSKKEPRKDFLRICVVGYLHKNKGQIDVIKAIDDLVNHRGLSQLHLSLIGEGNEEYTEELKKYVEDHKLSSYVDFLGYRDDVNQILNRMDVGIMSSAHEAFGRVTVEYLMSGMAVIASDSGANTEIIKNRQTGLLYNSGDSKDLADKINELIKDTDLLESLTKRGKQYAYANFSAKANADNIYGLYNKIMCNKNQLHNL